MKAIDVRWISFSGSNSFSEVLSLFCEAKKADAGLYNDFFECVQPFVAKLPKKNFEHQWARGQQIFQYTHIVSDTAYIINFLPDQMFRAIDNSQTIFQTTALDRIADQLIYSYDGTVGRSTDKRILLAPFPLASMPGNKGFVVIDGNHRVAEAVKTDSLSSLTGYTISPFYSEAAYFADCYSFFLYTFISGLFLLPTLDNQQYASYCQRLHDLFSLYLQFVLRH